MTVETFSLRRAFVAGLRRELVLSYRHKGDLANPLIFFLMVVVFTPLGISEDPRMLTKIAPGMLWVIALLATLLSLDGLFRSDYDDGSLEQMVLSPQPLGLLVLTKVFAHWLLTGVPLTLLAPVLISPNTISSATRPPSNPVTRSSNSFLVAK